MGLERLFDREEFRRGECVQIGPFHIQRFYNGSMPEPGLYFVACYGHYLWKDGFWYPTTGSKGKPAAAPGFFETLEEVRDHLFVAHASGLIPGRFLATV